MSPIKNEIIASIRKHGGKANYHDINGNKTPEWDSKLYGYRTLECPSNCF